MMAALADKSPAPAPAADGPPDLQELVRAQGGYDRIPPEVWAEFDLLTAGYQARRRAGLRPA